MAQSCSELRYGISHKLYDSGLAYFIVWPFPRCRHIDIGMRISLRSAHRARRDEQCLLDKGKARWMIAL